MYATEARSFILKLIEIQRTIERKRYVRSDRAAVVQARQHLARYLTYYRLDNDDKMRAFFERNADRIRTLIPGEGYSGYQKLMNEFIKLKHDGK